MCDYCDPEHFVKDGIERVEGEYGDIRLVRYSHGSWYIVSGYDDEGTDEIFHCPWCGRKLD